jgi:arsenite methyltransferase
MNTDEQVKKMVREKYAEIADQSRDENATSCCGATCGCSSEAEDIMAETYDHLPGYSVEADLGLGCGLPTAFAEIKPGDVVVDLGSGAGNDCFVARSVVGNEGKIIGVDMTERMIEKARNNAAKLGYDNVEFRLGEIEDLPMSSNLADVLISNCVMNLVPDKAKAFTETFRVLKPGGHFSISDIVIMGNLPESLKASAELYAGCIAGAIQKYEYLEIIRNAGFENLIIQKEKKISMPEEMLMQYLSPVQMEDYKCERFGIYSITVFAEKPSKKEACCGPDCCH